MRQKQSRFAPPSVFASAESQLHGCIDQQRAGELRRWVLLSSRGVNSFEASLRSRFARQPSCAPRASCASAPRFRGSSLASAAVAGRSGRARPVAARNGAPIRRNACSARRASQTEAEIAVLTRSPVVAEAKITALWELRTLFGPRGSPPKPLEDLPAEVQRGSCFDVWSLPDGGREPWAGEVSSRRGASALRSI